MNIGNLQINKLCLGDVEVSKAYLGDVEVYGSTKKYMTMTVLDGASGTTIAPTVTGTLSPLPNLQYRVNNGSWNDFIVGTTADIQVVAGDVVQFKGVNESGISTSDSNYLKFAISGNPVALSGNIMSLIDGVGDALVIPNDYCFYKLFSTSNVKTVSLDFLPAMELTKYCYNDLFSESLLENTPELPALTMKECCYRGLFYGCTALTTAPALPATTLALYCYQGLFQKCTSLVNTPSLPAQSLKPYCYYFMFSESAITKAPELPAENLSSSCYESMFSMCKSLTEAPALPAKNMSHDCYRAMFYKCTSLTKAPALPAVNLSSNCYYSMFYGCTSLTTPPELPATSLQPYCYKNMFNECTRLSQAPTLPATVLAQGCYDSMFLNCASITTPPELPATVITDSCYYQMFYNCSNLLTAPELPGENLENHCYERMFMGCHVLAQAPVLNCTTLVDNCYRSMFEGCWELNYVKSMATQGTINSDGTAPLALQKWLYGVSDTGTFEKPAAAVYVTDSPSGIPVGWTIVEEKPQPVGKYMTMTVLDGNAGTTIAPTVKGSLPNLNLQYRINSNGDWTNFIFGTTADIHVVAGDWIQFKGNNTSGISVDYNNYLNFAISGNPVSLSGNVMSLIDGVGDTLVIPNKDCFCYLFENSNIKTISKDFLPATTLKNNCYERMFWKCTSLTTAPVLPATTLEDSCYIFMFYGCTSLTTAPELPATTLKPYCYQSLFSGCSNLNYIKCLATSGTIKNGSVPMELYNWVSGVSPTGTFVKPTGVEYVLNSNGGIPEGWTIQNI